MLNKKFYILIALVALIIFMINFISAAEVSYCCEKTKSGAWCQNAPQSQCDVTNGLRATPASCEAVSYCQKGFCFDDKQGTCDENTPEKVCELNGGKWQQDNGKIPVQCQLGCCLIGDQAAYVTQTRCKKLSAVYGLETDFRSNVASETQCISLAHTGEEGACVFGEIDKTCKRTTKEECDKMKAGNATTEFHPGFLCSAPELGTICGKTRQTSCIEGKDETYFIDSCGNKANIYDSSKVDDVLYWSRIVSKDNSCGPGSNNANSKSCGNCNYFSGSICKKVASGDVVPVVGNSICKDLSCSFQGKTYQHGETFCSQSEDNKVGSRYYRYVCFNGEVQVEPCADFRQQVCEETVVNGFRSAACVTNKWQDCYSQTDQKSCENPDKRDCKWIKGVPALSANGRKTEDNSGACVPANAPGFDFWQEGDAQQICSLGNAVCIVTFEKGIIGGEKAVKNANCLDKSWVENMNKVCMSLGDCGGKLNFVGDKGYTQGYKVGTKKDNSSDASSSNDQTQRFASNTPTTQPSTSTTAPTTSTPSVPAMGNRFIPGSGATGQIILGWIGKLFGGSN